MFSLKAKLTKFVSTEKKKKKTTTLHLGSAKPHSEEFIVEHMLNGTT